MPSSLIFTGLVVLWLLILVPAIARHQQEVARAQRRLPGRTGAGPAAAPDTGAPNRAPADRGGGQRGP